MYYKGTYQECLDYDNQVSKSLGLINGDNWANPIKHPTKDEYAILKHVNYSALETQKWVSIDVIEDGEVISTKSIIDESYSSELIEVSELTEDWTPKLEII